MITVLVGVYASQDGEWSVTAQVTIGIVAFTFVYTLVASLLYQYLLWQMHSIGSL